MYWQLIGYALIGIISGTLAGLLGIGGGIIIIPALLLVFSTYTAIPPHLLMHFVVGTSFAAILTTTLSSLYAQSRHGSIFLPLFLRLFIGISIGTVLGTVLASFLDTHILKTLFGAFMILVATQMFFQIRQSSSEGLPSPIYRWGAALFIGLSSGLLGIGGGALTIPYLSYFKIPIRQAMATSTACGVLIALIGTLGFIVMGLHDTTTLPWCSGYVYWPAAAIITVCSLGFVKLGSAWSQRLPVETLRKILAAFILAVGLKMLF